MLKTLILILITMTSLCAKEIYYTDEVTIPISKKKVHLFLDERIVHIDNFENFIVQQAESETIKDKDYRAVSVSWKGARTYESVIFLLANRKKLTINFIYTPESDGINFHKSYELIAKSTFNRKKIERIPIDIQARLLLKAMKKREALKGFSPNRANRELKDGYEDIVTVLKGVQAGRSLNGFFIKVTNNSDKKIIIDYKNIKIHRPDLAIISFVDKKSLKQRESTHLISLLKNHPTIKISSFLTKKYWRKSNEI